MFLETLFSEVTCCAGGFSFFNSILLEILTTMNNLILYNLKLELFYLIIIFAAAKNNERKFFVSNKVPIFPNCFIH